MSEDSSSQSSQDLSIQIDDANYKEDDSSELTSESSDLDIIQRGQPVADQADRVKYILQHAQECLDKGRLSEAQQAVEEAFRINPRHPPSYTLMGNIMHAKQNNAGELQFLLAAAIMEKNIKELITLFPQIFNEFGDSRVLRLCASKIFQFASNDQQRTGFYNYLMKKQKFGMKSLKKLKKSYVLSLQESHNLIQEISQVESIQLKIQLYSKIMLNLNDQNTDKSQLEADCIRIVEEAYQTRRNQTLKSLNVLLRTLVIKNSVCLHLLLYLSVTSPLTNRDLTLQCVPELLKTLISKQPGDTIQDQNLIIEYLVRLLDYNESLYHSAALKIVRQLARIMPSQPKIALLFAQANEKNNFMKEAAEQYVQAVNLSLEQDNTEDGCVSRLALSSFLLSQKKTPTERMIKILLQDEAEQSTKIVCRRTFFPTLNSYYIKKFSIAVLASSDKKKWIMQTDLRLRAMAACIYFSSPNFAEYEQQFVELIYIPLVQVLMHQILTATRNNGNNFIQNIDEVLVHSVRCYTNIENQCNFQTGQEIIADGLNNSQKIKSKGIFETEYIEQIQNILSSHEILRLAIGFLQLAAKQQLKHCQGCMEARQLVVTQLLLTLHKEKKIILTDQFLQQLTTSQVDLAISSHHEILAYKSIIEIVKKDPSNANNVYRVVKLALGYKVIRQQCIKMLTRLSNKFQYIHLTTALVVLDIGQDHIINIKKVLQKVCQEYNGMTQNFSLELQLVNLYMLLSQTKSVNAPEEVREKAVKHMRKYMYDQPPTAQTVEFYYNIATVLLNQFGLTREAAHIFGQILGEIQPTKGRKFDIPLSLLVNISKDTKIRAAINLSLIYQYEGNTEAAQYIINKWLTKE